MRISKYIALLSVFIFHLSVCHAQLSMREMGDSLMAYTGFSRLWSPTVRVSNLRVNGNNITVKTNASLKGYRWTPENVQEIKQKVSIWTLGHPNGKVTILTAGTDIENLITPCAKITNRKSQITNQQGEADLTDRLIVLYPSHGLYFNRDRQEWIWQRATLWTTVEDLYSQEYVRLIKRMLENAGGTVLMPRAGLETTETGLSGMPQWAEGARYWLMSHGADEELWNLYEGNEYKDDMKCRAMWVNAQECLPDLCVAFHTDGQDSGNDSTIIGTLAIYTAHDDDGQAVLQDGRDRETTNRNLADWIQTQVTEDLRHIAPEWTRRQLMEANYCESRVPVVPSIILELLSHKNMADMRYGLDPRFRFTASRAVYKGILRYLNGPQATVQPLPVQDIGITPEGLLQWAMPVDSLEPEAIPTYYMVYVQADDGEWDVQQVEKKTQVQLDLQPGVRYNFYVEAGNAGGLSFPSPMISAYKNDKMVDDQMVLIVDAFNDVYGPQWFADSTFAGIVPGSYACEDGINCAYIGQQWDYTRAHEWVNDDNCGWGACYRDYAGKITVGNTHNYATLHGRVLQQMDISYCSCTAGMLSTFNSQLSTFNLMDVICGRNRVPLTANSRQLIADYLDNSGRVLFSSDHISALDAAWTKRYLHASYYAANATHSGRVISPNHRPYQLVMTPNEEQLFTCTPEGLMPEKEAVKTATYMDMRVPAAVGYKKKTLTYGFPLEAAQDFDRIYRHAIEWILSNE